MSGARLALPQGPWAVPGHRWVGAVLRRMPPGLARLLPGLLALPAAVALFLLLGPGGNGRRVAAAALAVAEEVRLEDEALRRGLHATPAAAAPVAPAPQRFLREVVAAAAASGLRITRLAPAPRAEDGLELEATGRFPGLLRFVTEVELGRGALRGLRLRAAPVDGSLDVAVFLEPPRDGRAAPAPQAAAARAAVPGRDPFAAPEAPAVPSHRLTGITELEGGALMATIDGRDYRAGDALGEGVVRTVGPDWVELSIGGRPVRLRLAAAAR